MRVCLLAALMSMTGSAGWSDAVFASTEVAGRTAVLLENGRWYFEGQPATCVEFDAGLSACFDPAADRLSELADPDATGLVLRTDRFATEILHQAGCSPDPEEILAMLQSARGWGRAHVAEATPPSGLIDAAPTTWLLDDRGRLRLVSIIELRASAVVATTLGRQSEGLDAVLAEHSRVLAELDLVPSVYDVAFLRPCVEAGQ